MSRSDAIVDEINALIKTNNDAFNKKKETKIKCDKMLWKHLAFLVKDEIADYKAKDAAIEAGIKKESGNTVNTDEAFESMNAIVEGLRLPGLFPS